MKKKISLVHQVGRYFLAGVFAMLPLIITIGVAMWFTGFIRQFLGRDTVLGNFIKGLGLAVSSHMTVAYIIGWVAVLSVILLFGVIVEMGARKYIKRTVERVILQIPIIGKVYGAATQLVEIIGGKGEEELKGMRVVYCTLGSEKGVVFLALMPTPERFMINNIEHQAVLIPTAPVPVGGGLLLVPVESVQPADMTVEDFISIYLSMGASGSQYLPKSLQNLT